MLRSFLINMNIGNVIHYSVWLCKGLCISLFSSVFVMFIVKVCICPELKKLDMHLICLLEIHKSHLATRIIFLISIDSQVQYKHFHPSVCLFL